MSVTAVSGDDIGRLGIFESKNLQFTTPGLSAPDADGAIQPYIRGRGTNFSGPGLEGSIAIYIDDIYLQTQYGSSGLVDISQVQVLKGPQGTLYGRNATGGAILFSTNNPTQEFEGHVEAGFGSFDTRHLKGVVNVPVSDTLAVRFAGGYDKRDGFVRNVVDGKKQGASERHQFRAKALWEPTDSFSVLLKGEYQHTESDFLRDQIVDGTNARTGLKFYQTQQSPVGGGAKDKGITARVWSFSAHLDYKGEKLSVSNVTGYRDTKLTFCSDNEFLYPRDFNFCAQLPGLGQASQITTIPNPLHPDAPTTVPSAYDRTFTTETRVTTTFDGSFNFLLGANHQKSTARFSGILEGEAFGPLIPVFDNHTRVRSWAIYGEAYLNITDQLKITAGGRYSKDSKSIRIFNNGDVATAFGIPVAFLPATVFQKDSWGSFTPRVVLAYDTGAANFYVSYSAGFKSGGFNAPAIFPQVALRPEKIDGFEAGAKLRLLDNSLWLDLAAFHTKSKDIQVASIDTATGSVVQQNAATAKADGAEATIRFKANDNLTLQTGIAYLDSRFTSFATASVFDVAFNPLFGQNLLQSAVENLKGRETPLSPKWTMNGSATYEFALPNDWAASMTLSARYSSRYDFQAGAGGPQRYARQKSFAVVNLTGDITPPGDTVQVSWYVTNLFKQHYHDQLQTNAQTGSSPNGGGVYGIPALPRIIGGSIRVNF